MPTIESLAKHYDAGDVPNKLRMINYEKSNEECLLQSSIETKISLIAKSTSQDSSFSAFASLNKYLLKNYSHFITMK